MEIERKWLVSTVPDIPFDFKWEVYQSYLSAGTPEIRIRSQSLLAVNGEHDEEPVPLPFYMMTAKSDGDLSREEVEFYLSEEDYNELRGLIDAHPIHKTFYEFQMQDGHSIDVSIVDQEWIYAEVEFESEEEAKAYEFPFPECNPRDVTNEPYYKMKNYWIRTRQEGANTNENTSTAPGSAGSR